jgi:hypothetical protein
MLSRLFKSRARFDDPDPQVRRAAVLAIPDEEAKNFQDDFAELVGSDADLGVRRAALSKLHEGSRLERFLNDANPEIVRAAAEAIARDHDAAELLHHPEVRLAAIRLARDVEQISRLIGDVAYDQQLIRLAIEARSPKVRVAVADKLMKESSLVELEHVSRDKDKNVNRLARSRLEEIRHARAELDKAQRRAEELTHTVETQLKAESDPLFTARLGVVKHDWTVNADRHRAAAKLLASHGVPVDSIDELATRYAAQIERLDALAAAAAPIVVVPSKPAAPVEPSGARDDSAFAEALDKLERLLDSIRRSERDGFDEIDAIHRESRAYQDQWLAAADHRAPPERLAARFHAVTHTLSILYESAARLASHTDELAQSEAAVPTSPTAESPEEFEALWNEQRRARQTGERMGRTLERIGWPNDLPRPARLLAADDARKRLGDYDAAVHALHEQLVARVHDVIARLETQIEGGNLASAAGLEGEGKRLLHSLPSGTAKRIQGEFVALSVRVQELKDWRTFATHPKREEFTAEMEKLAAEPLQPALQAERIRELRQAWNDLGPVTNHHDRRLFDRFNHAAEAAFKPCREFFDAQAATRKFNLEQRRKICADLEGYLDGMHWEHADWRAAERILYTAREEWRKFHPVDRSPGRKLEAQFDALTARLHAKLKVEWDRNAVAKQAIVDEAKAIQAAGGDSRQAIDKIKALQQRWRTVGIVPRRIDQRLWKDFRAVCDIVFGQRDAARTEQRQAAESQLAKAEQVVAEFERALDGATSQSADAAVLTEFDARYEAIGDLPRDAARRLEQRFRDTERGYRVLLRQAQHDAVMRSVDRLYDVDAALADLEADLAGGADAASVVARLDDIDGLDRDRAGAFTERVTALMRGDGAALKSAGANTLRARQRLAIEMEIAAGLDTPAEFQQDRLALQVDRLNQGMKHRRVMDEAPSQLAERWCKTGPAIEPHPALRDRFFRACRTALE